MDTYNYVKYFMFFIRTLSFFVFPMIIFIIIDNDSQKDTTGGIISFLLLGFGVYTFSKILQLLLDIRKWQMDKDDEK